MSQQGGRGESDARRAEAALDRLFGHQRLLHRVAAIAAQPFDSGHHSALRLGHGDQAAAQRLAVDDNRARVAIAHAAAVFRPG